MVVHGSGGEGGVICERYEIISIQIPKVKKIMTLNIVHIQINVSVKRTMYAHQAYPYVYITQTDWHR